MSKFVLDIGPHMESLIGKLSIDRGLPPSEVLRAALLNYSYQHNELSDNPGHKVSIADERGRVVKTLDIL